MTRNRALAGVIALAAVVAIGILVSGQARSASAGQPRLVELGSKECIPCKLMAPILEELKTECAGKLDVQFIDVGLNENVALAKQYNIRVIPTQVFLDASGKELWRHEGFISKYNILAKWRELKVDVGQPLKTFERMEAATDTRPKSGICYMCDGNIDPKTATTVQTEKGPVQLCGPHCYFIMYSCLTQDKTGLEKKVMVVDYAAGKSLPAPDAVYLQGCDEKTGRPTIKAFADRDAAVKERQVAGGNIVSFAILHAKELATRCGFCDRAVYPEDAALVKVDGLHTWGCCSHCAMGVAARTGKDIEVHQPDRLTGEMVVVKTLDGNIASLQPRTAVAWFGLRKSADGKPVSAGCFHQGFFTSEANLLKWVEQNPTETGKQISIDQALADKLKLTPQQISKACKIGECAPK